MKSAPQQRPRRPFWLKLIAAVLLLISLWGWLRLEQALYRREALTQAGIYPGALYLAVTGAVIGLAAGAAFLAVWRRVRIAPRLGMMVLTGWVIWLWADRLWISRSPIALVNDAFLLGVCALILGGSGYALWKGRSQFR